MTFRNENQYCSGSRFETSQKYSGRGLLAGWTRFGCTFCELDARLTADIINLPGDLQAAEEKQQQIYKSYVEESDFTFGSSIPAGGVHACMCVGGRRG